MKSFCCFQVLISLSALLAVSLAADIHAPSYHAPKHEPSYHPAPYKEPEYAPPHYEYKYGVDAYDGYQNPVQFGANEARDGYATYGEYHVALPDGRLQTVTYKVDDAYSGVVMDVKYSDYGKPHEVHGKGYHPEPKGYHAEPKGYHAEPVHKPVYHTTPIHKPIHHAPTYHA